MYAGDEHYSDDTTSGIGDRLDQGPRDDEGCCEDGCVMRDEHDECMTLEDLREIEAEERRDRERDDGHELYG